MVQVRHYGCGLARSSEDQDVVGRQRPFAEQFHAAGLDALDHDIRPEPAGLGACPSGCDLASPGKGGHHALDVVEALGGLLPRDGALHAISEEEDTHAYFGTLDQIQPEAQGVVGAFVPVGTVVDDDQVAFRGFVHQGIPMSAA